MTRRGKALLILTLGLLLCAMASGSKAMYTAAMFGGLILLFSFAGAALLIKKTEVAFTLDSPRMFRGEEVKMEVTVRFRGFLPAGSFRVVYSLVGQEGTIEISSSLRGSVTETLRVRAMHIGPFSAALPEKNAEDLFGLFLMKKRLIGREEGLVLPLTYPLTVQEPGTSGEDGRARDRASEDPASPDDTRPYRPGDAMKRVHWKLSARRREMTVRRFEMPVPPDTLILTDLTPLPAQTDADMTLRMKDAVLETAAAAGKTQLKKGSPVRAPFYDSPGGEFGGHSLNRLDELYEMLARRRFDAEGDFSEVLMLEQRRLRRVSAVAVITPRLTPRFTEAAAALRRAGPRVRVYFVTFTPDSPEAEPLVIRLERENVEVCYVTPS